MVQRKKVRKIHKVAWEIIFILECQFQRKYKELRVVMLEGEISGQSFFLSFIFIYLAVQGLSCSIQDLLVAVCGI